MSLSDKFLVAFVILWIVLSIGFWFAKLQGWALMWFGILAIVIIVEALSYVYTQHTVTQLFQAVAQANPVVGVTLWIGMLVAWLLLLIHLAT